MESTTKAEISDNEFQRLKKEAKRLHPFFQVLYYFDEISADLDRCHTQEEITNVFESYEIFDLTCRVWALHRVMNVSIESDDMEDADEKDYDVECSIFLEGSWRKLTL